MSKVSKLSISTFSLILFSLFTALIDSGNIWNTYITFSDVRTTNMRSLVMSAFIIFPVIWTGGYLLTLVNWKVTRSTSKTIKTA